MAHALLYTCMSIIMFILLRFSFSVSPNNKHEYIILQHVHKTLKIKVGKSDVKLNPWYSFFPEYEKMV